MATKQSLLAAAAVCLLLLPAAYAFTDVEYCNKGKNYPVKVSGVEIVPDPVERGVPATFKISATTEVIESLYFAESCNVLASIQNGHLSLYQNNKNITEGKLVIDVKYWIFNVYSETDDICTKTQCPATSNFELSHSQTLPSITPPGSYTIQMKMLGKHDEELSCISFGFSIGFLAPVALS
uniref:MD-2-related lipid-recognition domain-containing protein n=1 Tax=Aegilops tauschii TaxID=37682 RepID=M8CA68_AEGTA